MRFIIPSCGRSEQQLTVHYLLHCHVPGDLILVQTQTLEDYSAYQAALDGTGVHVGYGEAHNLAGNVNNALADLGDDESVVIMDDDVHGLYMRCPLLEVGDVKAAGRVRARIAESLGLHMLLASMALTCKALSAGVIGIRSNTNTSGYKRLDDLDNRFVGGKVLAGTLLVGKAGNLRMDASYDYGEDLELSLRLIRQGLPVLTDRAAAPSYVSRKFKPDAIGGRPAGYDSPENQACFRRLIQQYDGLATMHGDSSIRCTKTPEKIKAFSSVADDWYSADPAMLWRLSDEDMQVIHAD